MSQPSPDVEYVLTLTCPEAPGIVFAVSRFVMEHGGNISASQQFDDRLTDRFFMRVQFRLDGADVEQLRLEFLTVARQFAMVWELHDVRTPTRTLLMVSRFGHCLNDLLFRTQTGALNIEIPAIVSNHRDFEAVADANGIPFHHVPVTAETKPEAEARLLELVDELDVDLVVLARYMQVVTQELVEQFRSRIINIHPSLLPYHPGANAYKQAFEEGCRVSGCTAHFVTEQLDQGPVVLQDVFHIRVGEDTLDEVRKRGQELEGKVLSQAVQLFAADQLVVKDKKVIFRPGHVSVG